MAVLAEIYIKRESLIKLIEKIDEQLESGIKITVSISDEIDLYNQNVSVFLNQKGYEIEESKKRFYLGRGKVNWTNDIVTVPQNLTPEMYNELKRMRENDGFSK